MADRYTIDFTDRNTERSFSLAPYTTDGPRNPTTFSLDSKATSAATSLLLYGKGTPEYGERIQENLIHMLENFAGSVEPVYPINGQLWLDRSTDTDSLRVYNAFKYLIVADPGSPTDNNVFAIAPLNTSGTDTGTAERADMIARFTSAKTIRVTDASTGETRDFVLTANSSENADNNIKITVTPALTGSPTMKGTTWYVGGWEYIPHSNSSIREHITLNANASPSSLLWTIKNVPNPIETNDVANKAYVDAQIAGQNEIGELADVAGTASSAPSDGEILVYVSGTSLWTNLDPSDPTSSVIAKAGDTGISGLLEYDNGVGTNLAAITGGNPQTIVTKEYVDSIGGSLAGLSDTEITSGSPGLVNNSFLIYKTSPSPRWIDVDPTDATTNNPLLTKAVGGTLLAGKSLFYDLTTAITSGNQLVTKDYVDTSIVAASGDTFVAGGSFNPSTEELTLTYSEVGSPLTPTQPDLVISLSGVGGDTSTINHTLADGNTDPLFTGNPGQLALEKMVYSVLASSPVGTRDEVPLNIILTYLNEYLGRTALPRPRVVFTYDDGASSPTNNLVNFGITGSPNTLPGQVHPVLPNGGPVYVPGYNQMGVYVNGVKYVASEHGFRDVTAVDTSSPANDFNFYEITETGLDSATSYDFDISVNGLATVTVTISGANAQTMGDLVDAINAVADANYTDGQSVPFGSPLSDDRYAFGAVLQDGGLFFYSSIPGVGSSIDLTDGSGTPLFASITGDAAGRGLFSINLPLSLGETNAIAPVEGGYNEIGRVGRESQYFEFTYPTPTTGDTVEVVIDHDMFYDRLP